MWMQKGRIWLWGKIEFSVDLEISGKNTQLKIAFKSEVKVVYFYERNNMNKIPRPMYV